MPEDEPLLRKTGKGLNLFYGGSYLYSTVDPEGRAENRASNTTINEGTLVFIPSIGLGYGLNTILKKLPRDAHILCIEADEKLFKLALTLNPSRIPRDERITVVRTTNPDSIRELLRRINLSALRRVSKVTLSKGYILYRQLYDYIEDLLSEEIASYWQSRMTIIGMGNLWMRNILINLPHLGESYDIASIKLKSPAFVIGAGPSARDALPEILDFTENAVVIAVDSSLPLLCDINLKPDFIVTVDSQLTNLFDFLPCRFQESYVITDLSVNPNIFRLPERKYHFSFLSQFSYLGIFERLKKMDLLPSSIRPLGSVGNTAVHLANRVSNAPVITIGLDFSYTRGLTHSIGSAFHQSMLHSNNRFLPLELENLNALFSRPRFIRKRKEHDKVETDIVLDNFANLFREMADKSGKIYSYRGTHILDEAHEISNREELKNIIPGNRKNIEIERKSFDIESLGDFYHDEKRILAEAEKLIIDILEGDVSLTADVLNDRRLRDIDYTYFFFPDFRDGIPEKNRGFLERILISARYFMKFLSTF